MGITYTYDESAAGHADDFVNRIDQSAAFVGQFKRAEALKSARTGTEGIRFEFDAPGEGGCRFDIYTVKQDGTKLKGFNQVMAMMTCMGIRSGLETSPGKVQKYIDGEMQEVDGEVFTQLLGKDIGLVLQREDYTNETSHKDSYRMNLSGVFHAKSRLMASEIREHKTEPLKLARALRGLKNIDSRVHASEPDQPPTGAPRGDY